MPLSHLLIFCRIVFNFSEQLIWLVLVSRHIALAETARHVPSNKPRRKNSLSFLFFFFLHLRFSEAKTPLLLVLTGPNPVISVLYMWDGAEGLWWHLKLLINIRVTEGSPAAAAKLPRQFTSALKSQSPAMRFTHTRARVMYMHLCA